LSATSLAFKTTWLWSIFAGFYLVACSFWLPSLFSSLVVVIPAAALTLVLGLSFLYDGFRRPRLSGAVRRPGLSP